MTHRIAVIPGDGIGTEVIEAALQVMTATGVEISTTHYDLGGERYRRDGTLLPDEVLEEWRGLDALLLGAVGTPEVPSGVLERGLLLRMRFGLDLYVNRRPLRRTDGVDIEVIRENTEGPYAGAGGFLRFDSPQEIATQESVNTRHGVERCVRYAFELARGRRRHLTMVHKTNVLTYAGNLWQRVVEQVGVEYPDVETAYHHADAACIYLVESPQRYDVIVTDNLFGDILTDLGAALTGGIGVAASANLNPERTGPSMFEPVHGSAPDIAGTDRANPVAAVLSAAMMLDHLGEADAAARIRQACTADVFTGSTRETGATIAGAL